MRGSDSTLWIALAVAAALAVGILIAAVAFLRSGGGKPQGLPPELEAACRLIGLSPATGRWTPPACVGEVDGVRVALVTGVADRGGIHVSARTVDVRVDTGLHPGMTTPQIDATGLRASLPPDVALLGGASLHRGGGADLAIRSRWPEGWDALYLAGVPGGGGPVSAEALDATLRRLLEIRRELLARAGAR
jgi:hypothetical protein